MNTLRIQELQNLLNARASGAGPSQESLTDQLQQLIQIAETLGFYDAVDFLRSQLGE